jgi:hypothetical protein
LLALALVGACAVPTDTATDRVALGKAPAGPTVTATDPPGAPQDTVLDVHVTGSGFDRGSKVAFVRNGIVDPKLHVNGTSYRTSGELIANVTIAADAATIAYDVMVTTSSGKKGIGTELFAVEVPFEPLDAPAGFSDTYDAGPSGLISGRVTTSCSPGWTPAVWDVNRSLTALPALPGTCGGVARGVNGAGVAVGSAYIGTSRSLPARWLPGPSGYTVEQLPPLPGGKDPGPWAINESGWIGAGNDAAVWTPTTGWQLALKPAGATSCTATQVGNGGQIIASCLIGGLGQPVFWATISSPPTLLPLPSGATGAHPKAVSAAGVVVGFSTGSGFRAVRWTSSSGAWTAEFLPDLGRGGSALAMNEAGEIAGSVNGTFNFSRPAWWTAAGELQLLSTGNRPGEAIGISEPEAGRVIAGYYSGKSNKSAIRWRP